LHDNLAQLLVSAQINVGVIKEKLADRSNDISAEIAEINNALGEGISDIKELTNYIIPIDMEEEGVVHAFRFLIKQTQKLYNIRCQLQTGEVIHEIKNIEVATNLYHIIQEAIRNAVVHGQADYIKVRMSKPGAELVVQIEDNGTGLSEQSSNEGGNGFRSMKHRMELLGGQLHIENKRDSANGGTIVTCGLPLEYLTEKDAKPMED